MGRLKKPHPSWVILALLSVQLLFGVNYVVSKVVVDTLPPLVWASGRMLIAAFCMLVVALVLRRPHPKGGAAFFGPLVVFSMFGIVINQSCFLVGLHYTTPSNSAVLNTLTPIFTLMIVTMRGQERKDLRKVFGFLCAFAGVLVLRKVEEFTLSNQTALGDLLIIMNCLSFSYFIAFGKRFLEKHDQFWTTAWLFLYGSVGLTAMALPEWTHFSLPPMNQRLLACILFAIFGGTLLTYFLNNWTLKYAKSSHVALFIYIQPVIAIALAWLWMGHAPTLRTLLSCGLIFLGMLIALSREPNLGFILGENRS